MALSSILARVALVSSWGFLGRGYVAGTAPTEPDGPDGRAKKLNEPGQVRIVVLDKITSRGIASAVSAPDGTWRIPNLDERREYVVIGFDGLGQMNAAIQDRVKPHVPEP